VNLISVVKSTESFYRLDSLIFSDERFCRSNLFVVTASLGQERHSYLFWQTYKLVSAEACVKALAI